LSSGCSRGDPSRSESAIRTPPEQAPGPAGRSVAWYRHAR
jgi:hypothetical protein